MSNARCRVVFALTHPVQYMSPLFRRLSADHPECELTVLYASMPLPEQQGVGFDTPFTWTGDLLSGYRHEVLGTPDPSRRFGSDDLMGVDVSAVGAALDRLRPDVVVVPGWHSIFYLRVLWAARRRGIPLLYRGDTNLQTAPSGWRRLPWSLRTWALLRMFDGWLAVGTRSRRYLEHFGLAEPLIVDSPHAVEPTASALDEQAREETRRRLGATADDFLLVFAGKLVDVKRPADVLQAAHRVRGAVVVAMVGSGPLEASLRELARTLGVRTTWCGFRNQSEMPQLLAAADCLVLPSRSDTWGFVVNEALTVGTPCVVADTVGCADDLLRDSRAGAVFPSGDVEALSRALADVRDGRADGRVSSQGCRDAVERCSMSRAASGIARAARRVSGRAAPRRAEAGPRVVAAFGNMAFVSGVERMSFEVLRVLRESGAAVHCIVNRWDSSAVVAQAEVIDATWSFGYYRYPLPRKPSLRGWSLAAWDVARTSLDLWRDIRRARATHVFAPEFNAVLRSLPALWLARWVLGVRVIVRLGNAPEPGPFYRALWRVLASAVDRFVPNSRFIEQALLAHGIDNRQTRVVFNTVPHRNAPWIPRPRVPGRVVFVGQIIPLKGVDLLLEAAARLRAEGVALTLDIVGATDRWEPPSFEGYRDTVMARASRPDLAGCVRFLGQREDVPGVLAEASVHCMPSRPEQKEGFAVALLEAKRSGLPSVVTACGALPEMVRHREDGWVCAEATVDALADGLRHFLTNPDAARRAGELAHLAERAYSHDRFASAWREVFSEGAAHPAPVVVPHR